MNNELIKTIRIAVPSNGRMFDDVKNIFANLDIDITPNGRELSKEVIVNDIKLLFYYLRSKDIPFILKNGTADIGFSTDGPILENNIKSLEITPLHLGEHRFVLAMLNGRSLNEQSVRATSYPEITKRFLAKKGLKTVKIIPFSGSVEAAPLMEIADGIVEITQTGASLVANNLIETEEIYLAQTLLATNRNALKNEHIKDFYSLLKGN